MCPAVLGLMSKSSVFGQQERVQLRYNYQGPPRTDPFDKKVGQGCRPCLFKQGTTESNWIFQAPDGAYKNPKRIITAFH